MDVKWFLLGVTSLAVVAGGIFFLNQSGKGDISGGGAVSVSVGAVVEQEETENKGSQSTGLVTETSLRNVMYYSDWSIWDGQGNYYPQNLPAEYYTHLNLAFLDFDASGYLRFTDTAAMMESGLTLDSVVWGEANGGILATLRSLRGEHPNMKLGVSLGGWSKSGDFATMASQSATRATFIGEIIAFLDYTSFDFVDLDWEYPAVVRQADYTDNQQDEGTPSATAADKENYILLLDELRKELDKLGEKNGKYYELSVALPMDQEKLQAGIAVEELFAIVDFANIMTYDAHGAFDTVTGHHTALYGNPMDPFYEKGYSIDQSVDYLLAEGAVAEKIVVGAAFYARGWESVENTSIVDGLPALFATASATTQNADGTASLGAKNDLAITLGDGGIAGGVWAFRNFDLLHSSYSGLVEYWDDVAKAPYLYNGSAFFTYDNEKSVAEKAKYVHENGLGGIISWQASNDKVSDVAEQRDTLTKAIYQGLFGETALPSHEIVSFQPSLRLDLTENALILTNSHQISEVSAVLRPVEIQSSTVTYPLLYLKTGGEALTAEGYAIREEEGYFVVDLATKYENRFLSVGQTLRIGLNSTENLEQVILAQRQTATGGILSYTLLYGEGDFPLAGDFAVNSGGNSDEFTEKPDISTAIPSETSSSASVQGTVENPVAWSEEAATTGLYGTGSVVSFSGKIYQAKEQIWWGNPQQSPQLWTEIAIDENYIAPDPVVWNREDEALGAYVSGVLVTHGGKTYLQIGDGTTWWCEPGTDASIWQEQ